MAGWLAGQSVGRSAWQGPTHGTCASGLFVPPRIRTLLASPLSLVLPLRLFLHVSRRPVTLSLGKVEEPRSEAFFLYWHSRPPSQSPPPLPTPRHGIESSRHGVRMDGERETEKKKKIKRTSGETTRSGTKIARHAGNRVKGSKRERVKEGVKWKERKRKKGRIRWGGAFQSRSEAPRVPTTIEKGETCRRGYRRGQ